MKSRDHFSSLIGTECPHLSWWQQGECRFAAGDPPEARAGVGGPGRLRSWEAAWGGQLLPLAGTPCPWPSAALSPRGKTPSMPCGGAPFQGLGQSIGPESQVPDVRLGVGATTEPLQPTEDRAQPPGQSPGPGSEPATSCSVGPSHLQYPQVRVSSVPPCPPQPKKTPSCLAPAGPSLRPSSSRTEASRTNKAT